MNTSQTTTRLTVRGCAAWLTLHRPRSMNAMNGEMVAELGAALDRVEPDPVVKVLVVTGHGRAFCAGADLNDAKNNHDADDGDQAAERFLDDIQQLMLRIESYSKPTVCAINGITMGVGLELALCCDIIVANRQARIGDGHAKFGLLPGGGSSARLPRRIPLAAAKRIMFTADLFEADDLVACGLIQDVFDADAFEGGVQALCDRIGSRSPLAISRIKELVNQSGTRTLAQALAAEREMMRLHRTSNDRAEGLAAFAEKRKPHFIGR